MLQLFLATFLNLPSLFLAQLLPHRTVHLNDPQRFGVAHHVHVLEAFEGVGEDVPLGLLVGIAALGKDAVGLLYLQPGRAAGFVEAAKIGDDIADLYSPGGIRIGQDRFQQDRLIGIAPGTDPDSALRSD